MTSTSPLTDSKTTMITTDDDYNDIGVTKLEKNYNAKSYDN